MNQWETHNGKQKQARKMKPTCKETCRLKCTSKISYDQRKHIFDSYWKMGNIDLQRQYIVNCTKEVKPTYRCIKKERKRPPRANNFWYLFPVDGSQTRVCKTFFLNTLDINDRVTRTASAKQNETGGKVVEEDKRGKHENHAAVDPQIKEGVRAHIDSIPRIESHYARARTQGPTFVALEVLQTYTGITLKNVEKTRSPTLFMECSTRFSLISTIYHSLHQRKTNAMSPCCSVMRREKIKKN